MIGAGIVAIPSATYAGGISFGLFLCLFLCPLFAVGSGYLFIKSKMLTPVTVDSLYELCYVNMGKWSIHLIALIAVINNIGFCIIYFILFSDTAAQLALGFGVSGILASRAFWAVVLGAGLLPVILKEHLHEIKLLSYLLFGVAGFYLLLLVDCQVMRNDAYNDDPSPRHYFQLKWGLDMVSSLSVFLCAFNYSFAEFPVYRALGPTRSPEKMQKVIIQAVGMVAIVYAVSAVLGVHIFGSNIAPSILENFGREATFFGYSIQVLFLFLLASHIPYIFMFAKEGGYIVLDELHNGSISRAIEHKLAGQEEVEQEPRTFKHTLVTLVQYFFTIFIACQTDNLGALFDYVGALSVSGIQFFVPGAVMVILQNQAVEKNSKLLAMGWFYAGFSVFVTGVIFAANIITASQ